MITSTATTYYTHQSRRPLVAPEVLSTPGSANSWDTQCDFRFPNQGTQGTTYIYDGTAGSIPRRARRLPVAAAGIRRRCAGDELLPGLGSQSDHGTWRKFDPARNLALNKTVTASSALAANAATNVAVATTWQNYINYRWESAASDPQWIRVDLGAPTEINRVILKWHPISPGLKIQSPPTRRLDRRLPPRKAPPGP